MGRERKLCNCRIDGGFNGSTTTYSNGDVVCNRCNGIIAVKENLDGKKPVMPLR